LRAAAGVHGASTLAIGDLAACYNNVSEDRNQYCTLQWIDSPGYESDITITVVLAARWERRCRTAL
jgi:hypothetical protein